MRTLAILVTASLAASAAPALAQSRPSAGRADPRSMSAEERDACAADLEVLEKRTRLFEQQGLRPSEIAKRNETAQLGLDECVRAWRRQRTAEKERLADIAELERRTGPNATEAQRDEAWAQIRRERLSGKPPSQLTAEEKAELRAGTNAELAETHATLDTVHAKDPVFMRLVHSALACYHGVRRDRIKEDLSHEQSLVKLGQGDRNRVYSLKSDLRQSDEVLARSREAARGFKEGLGRCTEEKVAILAHCLAIRFEERFNEPACESEEIQQYIRFIK
jgi:hypothetical protein